MAHCYCIYSGIKFGYLRGPLGDVGSRLGGAPGTHAAGPGQAEDGIAGVADGVLLAPVAPHRGEKEEEEEETWKEHKWE